MRFKYTVITSLLFIGLSNLISYYYPMANIFITPLFFILIAFIIKYCKIGLIEKTVLLAGVLTFHNIFEFYPENLIIIFNKGPMRLPLYLFIGFVGAYFTLLSIDFRGRLNLKKIIVITIFPFLLLLFHIGLISNLKLPNSHNLIDIEHIKSPAQEKPVYKKRSN